MLVSCRLELVTISRLELVQSETHSGISKMSEIIGVFIKRLSFVLIMFFSNFGDVKSHSSEIDLSSIQFEQIKRDLFLKNDFKLQ